MQDGTDGACELCPAAPDEARLRSVRGAGAGGQIRRVEKPAQKARKGRNPATGEEITIKVKPARQGPSRGVIKGLKDVLA